MSATPELTLIVAATRSMGIGYQGKLPWTGLKKEMAYFARITKRVPSSSPISTINAVIMGRKTWESIPPKFRPLANRLNIVISRSAHPPSIPNSPLSATTPVYAPSLDIALEFLAAVSKKTDQLGRVFVIGGEQIYRASLESGWARRVLLTVVRGEFECDTKFPIQLGAKAEAGWVRRGDGEFDGWAGEEVPKGEQKENGTKYEFQMWEKEQDS